MTPATELLTQTSLGKSLASCRKGECYSFSIYHAICDQNIDRARGGRKLNGIIYLHRISDPRMGGQAKKNIRVFRELCGDNNLGNVRIVTTYWNRVDEQEGKDRETALANGAFKPLIDAGAKLLRHDRELESAQSIMSELIHTTPMTMKIQEELNAGRALGDMSAGAVIIEEMK